MYNRYIPGADGHTRVVVEEGHPKGGEGQARTRRNTHQNVGTTHGRNQNPVGWLPFFAGEDKNAGIAGILKSLHLEDLDSGDLLLLLIILFLVLEGDNLEVVITLGLMLLLGLGDKERDDQKE